VNLGFFLALKPPGLSPGVGSQQIWGFYLFYFAQNIPLRTGGFPLLSRNFYPIFTIKFLFLFKLRPSKVQYYLHSIRSGSEFVIGMIRIVVAEDHHLVRQGLLALLEKIPNTRVVGEASDGQEAVLLCRSEKPDIALLDVSMPRLNGNQAMEKIKAENLPTRIIFLSMHKDETIVRHALKSGANAYLLKSSLKEELAQAIEATVKGEIYLSEGLRYLLEEENPASFSRADHPLDLLTTREQEVLKLIAEGKTNSHIAEIIQVSVKTVEKYRSNMLMKLNLKDTTGLIRFAIQQKLVGLDDLTR
jgi:DNA-binding NarL/FixJ family response regulator